MPRAKRSRVSDVSDYPLTSQNTLVKKERSTIQLAPTSRFLHGAEVRKYRQAHNLSAKALAGLLLKDKTGKHFSRTYVKQVEGNSLRASVAFVMAFDRLAAAQGPGESAPRAIAALFHHMPGVDVVEIEILAAPVRCVCGKWFVPSQPRQKVHATDSCRRLARRLAEQKKKRRNKKSTHN